MSLKQEARGWPPVGIGAICRAGGLSTPVLAARLACVQIAADATNEARK